MLELLLLAEQPTAIVPEGWEQTVEQLHYSPAVVVGDLVILSGVVVGVPGYEVGGPFPDEDAMRAAYDRAFQAIGKILEEAGSDWDHVAELVTFHVDIDQEIGPLAEVKDKYINAPYPAWTAIDIDRLYAPGTFTEIKITATLKK